MMITIGTHNNKLQNKMGELFQTWSKIQKDKNHEKRVNIVIQESQIMTNIHFRICKRQQMEKRQKTTIQQTTDHFSELNKELYTKMSPWVTRWDWRKQDKVWREKSQVIPKRNNKIHIQEKESDCEASDVCLWKLEDGRLTSTDHKEK